MKTISAAIETRILHLVARISDRAESDIVRVLEQDAATTATGRDYECILEDMIEQGTLVVSLGAVKGPCGVIRHEPCYRAA